jgi:hypothetical protein
VSARHRPTAKAATVSPEEGRAIKRQLMLTYALALMLIAIAFVAWRVNELSNTVAHLQAGR